MSVTTGQSPTLSIGLRHSERMRVERRHTVPEIDASWPGFGDMPPVLATAMMVAFIEQTCIVGLRAFLLPGQQKVGTHVDVSHIAATPVGMAITADVELIGIEGKALLFDVRCRDASGVIGEGKHRRAIIDAARFMQRLQEKARQAPGGA